MMNIRKTVSILLMCAGLGLATVASSAPVSEQEWTFSPGVVQADAEWLSFTRASQPSFASNIQSRKVYAPGQIIHAEFDYVSWGGIESSGDGLSLYLFDTGVANAGTGGYFGGGLGYCRQAGAYLGIGLDENGTFASSFCENGNNRNPPSRNSVTVRGSQARGYASAGVFPVQAPLACKGPRCTTRQSAIDAAALKHVIADLIPRKAGPGYMVNLSINGELIVSGLDYPYEAPASMKIGIAGSNGAVGGATHEIRNVRIESIGDVCEPAGENLALGVPAYISARDGNGKYATAAYPILNDGDNVQKGWDGTGKWTGHVRGTKTYGLDFRSMPCHDSDVPGSCPLPRAVGKGPITINTVVVYFRQDEGTEREPDDSTLFSKYGGIVFSVQANEILPDGTLKWVALAEVGNNHLVKRTITFPTKRIENLLVYVRYPAGTGESPSVVELQAYNR
jgi:hypothetical protein